MSEESWKEHVAAFFNPFKFPIGTKFEANSMREGDTVMTIIAWHSFYVAWSLNGVPMVGAAEVPMAGGTAEGTAEGTAKVPTAGRDAEDNVFELPIVSVVVNAELVTDELGLVPGVFPYTVVDGFLTSDLEDNQIKQDLPAMISAKSLLQIVQKRILDTHNVHYRPSERDQKASLWTPSMRT